MSHKCQKCYHCTAYTVSSQKECNFYEENWGSDSWCKYFEYSWNGEDSYCTSPKAHKEAEENPII